jgi:hypothetical protein
MKGCALINGIDSWDEFMKIVEKAIQDRIETGNEAIILLGSSDIKISLYDETEHKTYYGAKALSIIINEEVKKRNIKKEETVL